MQTRLTLFSLPNDILSLILSFMRPTENLRNRVVAMRIRDVIDKSLTPRLAVKILLRLSSSEYKSFLIFFKKTPAYNKILEKKNAKIELDDFESFCFYAVTVAINGCNLVWEVSRCLTVKNILNLMLELSVSDILRILNMSSIFNEIDSDKKIFYIKVTEILNIVESGNIISSDDLIRYEETLVTFLLHNLYVNITAIQNELLLRAIETLKEKFQYKHNIHLMRLFSGLEISMAANTPLPNRTLTEQQILKKGADAPYINLNGAVLEDLDLSGTNFGNAYLGFASVSRTNLENCNLSGACFHETQFKEVNLSLADLSDSTIYRSHFSAVSFERSNLRNVDFKETALRVCVFNETVISGIYLPSLLMKESKSTFSRVKLIHCEWFSQKKYLYEFMLFAELKRLEDKVGNHIEFHPSIARAFIKLLKINKTENAQEALRNAIGSFLSKNDEARVILDDKLKSLSPKSSLKF